MQTTQVLVVEDERPIREMIGFGLRRAGFAVREAADCKSAKAELINSRPHLLLVDWGLPDASGLELVRELKRDRATRDLPVVMVTARSDEQDKIAGLEGGADDFITKPFSPRELLARINAVLRRSSNYMLDNIIAFEGLDLDQASERVQARGQTITLSATEYRLLEFLMLHPERAYSREQLLDRVWGANVYVEERTVDVHVMRLRKALEASSCDRFIQTVHGTGYRFSTRT